MWNGSEFGVDEGCPVFVSFKIAVVTWLKMHGGYVYGIIWFGSRWWSHPVLLLLFDILGEYIINVDQVMLYLLLHLLLPLKKLLSRPATFLNWILWTWWIYCNLHGLYDRLCYYHCGLIVELALKKLRSTCSLSKSYRIWGFSWYGVLELILFGIAYQNLKLHPLVFCNLQHIWYLSAIYLGNSSILWNVSYI